MVVLDRYKPNRTQRSVFGQVAVGPLVALVAVPMAILTSALLLEGLVLAGPWAVPRFLATFPAAAAVALSAPSAVQPEEPEERILAHIAPSAAEVVPEAAAEA